MADTYLFWNLCTKYVQTLKMFRQITSVPLPPPPPPPHTLFGLSKWGEHYKVQMKFLLTSEKGEKSCWRPVNFLCVNQFVLRHQPCGHLMCFYEIAARVSDRMRESTKVSHERWSSSSQHRCRELHFQNCCSILGRQRVVHAIHVLCHTPQDGWVVLGWGWQHMNS